MEVHLDLIGGIAGDMFIAALLDAMPQYESRVIANIQAAARDSRITCSLAAHRDDILQGRRFIVRMEVAGQRAQAGLHFRGVSAQGVHAHVSWASLRSQLRDSPLHAAVSDHAIAIFQLLADAEAHVHGMSADRVEFHEVGAWDSVADIVGAATLIDACNARRWTSSAVPLGAGRVNTQHGIMPIPAPATARLLLGLPTLADGVAGERVTPTGAAVLRYLHELSANPQPVGGCARALISTGTGFGSRALTGISNHLRVLCFEPAVHVADGEGLLQMIEFEVDDQTGEDLATGLDRLRAHAAVLDVVQSAVFGKKGRMMSKIQVLARPAHLDAVVDACFRETTTIGLRHQSMHRVRLDRRMETVRVQGQDVRVKIVNRPGGLTAKTESDDMQRHDDHAARIALRSNAEHAVLGHSTPRR